MEKLVLFGTEYEVPEEKVAYNEYRAIFSKEAQTAKLNLQDYFIANDLLDRADFDKVVEMGRTWINDALVMFVRTLTEKEIYEYSVDSIKRMCVVPITSFEETVENIYDQLDEIDLEWRGEQVARQQEIDSASSSWSGGGFGLMGALKGAVTAAALNVATGAVTKAVTSGSAKRAESAHDARIYDLLNDTDTVIEMSLALYDDIFSLVKTYIKILQEDKGEKIGAASEEEILKSNDIFTNIKSGMFATKPEVEKQMWIKIFTLYPYEISYYNYLLKNHNEVFDEAVKLMQWYKVPIEMVADTLLGDKYNFEAITELEEAQKQKELLTADLSRFGITESNLMYLADEKIEKLRNSQNRTMLPGEVQESNVVNSEVEGIGSAATACRSFDEMADFVNKFPALTRGNFSGTSNPKFAKKVKNAVNTYATKLREDEIFALYDDTILGSGKLGFVMTNKEMIINTEHDTAFHIFYEDIMGLRIYYKVGKFDSLSIETKYGGVTVTNTLGKEGTRGLANRINEIIKYLYNLDHAPFTIDDQTV